MKPTSQELKEVLPNISPDCMELNTGEVLEIGEEWANKLRQTKYNAQPTKKRSKYNAIPTTYNGVIYHSKKEAKFAEKLALVLKGGEIDYVLRQVPFDLGAGIIYRADFVTLKRADVFLGDGGSWLVTVYEVKGMETPAWKLKYKLFKEKYPLISLEII